MVLCMCNKYEKNKLKKISNNEIKFAQRNQIFYTSLKANARNSTKPFSQNKEKTDHKLFKEKMLSLYISQSTSQHLDKLAFSSHYYSPFPPRIYLVC